MRRIKIFTYLFLIIGILASSFAITSVTVDAKCETRFELNRKKVTIEPKGCTTLELVDITITNWGEGCYRDKIKWKVISGKKNIKLQKIKGTDQKVKVIGLKQGTAKIRITHRKQKFLCRVTVKKNDKIIRATKADVATAKKIHNRLIKGKAVYVLTNTKSERKAEKFIKKLSKKIGEYNTCGIGIDINDATNRFHDHLTGVKQKEKNYYYLKLSSSDAKGYKDTISGVKKWFAEAKRVNAEEYKSRIDLVAKKRAELKKNYAKGTSNYEDIFEEVTGISYKRKYADSWDESAYCNYLDGQVTKTKTFALHQNRIYYTLPDRPNGEWNHWYFISWEYNGKTYYYAGDELKLVQGDAVEGDFDNYQIYFNNEGLGWEYESEYQLKLSDVTFHNKMEDFPPYKGYSLVGSCPIIWDSEWDWNSESIVVDSPNQKGNEDWLKDDFTTDKLEDIEIKSDTESEYNLPKDWYYFSYKNDDGKIEYNTVKWGAEDISMSQENADRGDYDNYVLHFGGMSLKYSDVTFYYEPLKVDLAGVQCKIDKLVENELPGEIGVTDISTYTRKTALESAIEKAKKFCDLSQAQQVYYLIDTYCKYQGKKQAWKIKEICQYLGKSCYKDEVEVTNSKGKTAYLKFNVYGAGCSTDGYIYTSPGKKKYIENFVN